MDRRTFTFGTLGACGALVALGGHAALAGNHQSRIDNFFSNLENKRYNMNTVMQNARFIANNAKSFTQPQLATAWAYLKQARKFVEDNPDAPGASLAMSAIRDAEAAVREYWKGSEEELEKAAKEAEKLFEDIFKIPPVIIKDVDDK